MRLTRIGYAPIKGVRHLMPGSAHVAPSGVTGDRELAFVDAESLAALRTMRTPGLLQLAATWDGRTVTLESTKGSASQYLESGRPGIVEYWGRSIEADLVDGPVAALASEHLGVRVLLARAHRDRFVYAEPLTIIRQSELDILAARFAGTTVDPARFRANLHIDDSHDECGSTALIAGSAEAEDTADRRLLGAVLAVGDARLQVVSRVERCVVVDHDPTTGVRDLPVFRSLAPRTGHHPGRAPGFLFGYGARVLRRGHVSVGDPVTPE